jgi:hypothetical protein
MKLFKLFLTALALLIVIKSGPFLFVAAIGWLWPHLLGTTLHDPEKFIDILQTAVIFSTIFQLLQDAYGEPAKFETGCKKD